MTEIKAGEQRRVVLNKIRLDLTKGQQKLEPSPEVIIRKDRERLPDCQPPEQCVPLSD